MFVVRQKNVGGTLFADVVPMEDVYEARRRLGAKLFEKFFGGYLEVKLHPKN